MATVQVRNIPEDMHKRLRRLAEKKNSSMNAILLAALERELTHAEWQEHWEQLPTTDVNMNAAKIIREERAKRDADLDRSWRKNRERLRR